jgi:hypothetical protein
MNKRNFIGIVLITLVVALGILLYVVLTTNRNAPLSESIRNILPFGKSDNPDLSPSEVTVSTTTTEEEGTVTVPKLVKLSTTGVSGYTTLIKNGFETVRYVERATGHIVDVSPTTLARVEISINTYPKAYRAMFDKSGSSVIYQTLINDSDTINNTLLSLTPPKATSTSDMFTVKESGLRGGMEGLTTNGSSLFFFAPGTGIATSNFDGSKPGILLSNPYAGWRIVPFGPNLIVYSKPVSSEKGFAYILNSKSDSLSKLFGPLSGLVVNGNPSGSRIIFSFGAPATFSSLNTKSGATTNLTPVTFADKCAWSYKSPNIFYCGSPKSLGSNEPESWLAGISHYQDRIWRYDADTPFTDLLADPAKDFGVDIDVTDPKLSIDEDYLLFINKNDLSLWALRLD